MLALLYTTKFCCDCHSDGFRLQNLLPGKIYKLSPAPTKKRGKYPKYRATKERPDLDRRLIQWLEDEHKADDLRSVRPKYDILSDIQRKLLVRTMATNIQKPSDIVFLLGESSEWEEEWALKLFSLILQYETELKSNKSNAKSQTSHSNLENIPPTQAKNSRSKPVAKRARK